MKNNRSKISPVDTIINDYLTLKTGLPFPILLLPYKVYMSVVSWGHLSLILEGGCSEEAHAPKKASPA